MDRIEGTIEEAQPSRLQFGLSQIARLVVVTDEERLDLGSAIASGPVLAALVPGSAGTLYLHRLFGRTGVHGFRREDGTTLWAFPRVHYAAPVFAFLLAVLAFAAEYESYWLQTVRTPYSLFIGFGALVMLIIVERARRRARREFDSDPGLQPSAA